MVGETAEDAAEAWTEGEAEVREEGEAEGEGKAEAEAGAAEERGESVGAQDEAEREGNVEAAAAQGGASRGAGRARPEPRSRKRKEARAALESESQTEVTEGPALQKLRSRGARQAAVPRAANRGLAKPAVTRPKGIIGSRLGAGQSKRGSRLALRGKEPERTARRAEQAGTQENPRAEQEKRVEGRPAHATGERRRGEEGPRATRKDEPVFNAGKRSRSEGPGEPKKRAKPDEGRKRASLSERVRAAAAPAPPPSRKRRRESEPPHASASKKAETL